MLTETQIAQIEQRLHEHRETAIRTLYDMGVDVDAARSNGHSNGRHHNGNGRNGHSPDFAERHARRLARIDDALRRLRDTPETFDVSAVSGRRIPFERLDIIPWTRVLREEIPAQI